MKNLKFFSKQAGHVRVSFDAVDSIPMNPGHSVESTEFEIWGSEKRVSHPPMVNLF